MWDNYDQFFLSFKQLRTLIGLGKVVRLKRELALKCSCITVYLKTVIPQIKHLNRFLRFSKKENICRICKKTRIVRTRAFPIRFTFIIAQGCAWRIRMSEHRPKHTDLFALHYVNECSKGLVNYLLSDLLAIDCNSTREWTQMSGRHLLCKFTVKPRLFSSWNDTANYLSDLTVPAKYLRDWS